MIKLLQQTNDQYNSKPYLPDPEDHWQTPSEFQNGGDCEDYAIAKYFALKEQGVKRLRLIYCEALKLDCKHMVLGYFGEKDPLILDNLIPEILPLSERKDLMPIISFDEETMWLPNGEIAGKSHRIKKWADLQERMKSGRP